MDVNRFLDSSGRIPYEDLDWEEARRIGLTDDEVFVLTYFSDIESQTIVYMRDLLNTSGSLDADVIAFLTMWNYEEYFHGRALARLLEACGASLERNRIAEVRQKALVSETLTALGATFFSKMFPADFIALFMTWGATNEITTLRGYEEIEKLTRNPILAELCRRIARQERRHFAWYFNNAQKRLTSSRRSQRWTRFFMSRVWSPVGAGVKKMEEVARLFNTVFPGSRGDEVAREIDEKIGSLPGLAGVRLMTAFAEDTLRKHNEINPLSGTCPRTAAGV